MSAQSLDITDFSGGIARASGKKDVPFSARLVSGLSPHEDITNLVQLAKPVKVSGTLVGNLPVWGVDGSPYNTDRYFLDRSGKVYRETADGTWSIIIEGPYTFGNETENIDTFTFPAAGQGLGVYANHLYVATHFSFGRYGPLNSPTPVFTNDFLYDPLYGWTSVGTVGEVGDPPLYIGAYEETEHIEFTATGSSLRAVAVKLEDGPGGPAPFVFTIRDNLNQVVGEGSVDWLNSDGAEDDMLWCYFTAPIELVPGNAYRIFISCEDGGGAISTSGGWNNAYARLRYADLVDDAEWHPMLNFFGSMLLIGNGRFVASWNQINYDANRLVLPPGLRVRSMTVENEYAVIAAYAGESPYLAEDGYLFYWDGIAEQFNFFKRVSYGAPNAITGSGDRLLGVYGTSGSVFVGSDSFRTPTLNLPHEGTLRSRRVEIYPGALADWRGGTVMGVAGQVVDDDDLPRGVYYWSSPADGIAESLVHALPLSSGAQGTTVRIGMTSAFGEDLYIGWEEDGAFGVDRVSRTGTPQAAGRWESLILDNGNPAKQKMALDLVITFKPLVAGQTVIPIVRVDRGDWQDGTGVTAVGATSAHFLLSRRYHEIQFGHRVENAGVEPVTITSVHFAYDDLSGEGQGNR